jgi:hypothetical protein
LNGSILHAALNVFSISSRHVLPMNELASAIFNLPACVELLRFPVAEAAEIVIAAATSATVIGAIHRLMFMDSQLLSVRANRRSASWMVARERFSRRQRR